MPLLKLPDFCRYANDNILLILFWLHVSPVNLLIDTLFSGTPTLSSSATSWKVTSQFGTAGDGKGEFRVARGIAGLHNGDIAVIDTIEGVVNEFICLTVMKSLNIL